MNHRRHITRWTGGLGFLLCLHLVCPSLLAQAGDAALPSLVEVYWQSSKTVIAPGITNLIVLDSEITRAETGADTITFYGLERGETVVLGYAGQKPVSIRVRVLLRPMIIVSPETLRRQAEMGQGSISSNLQGSSGGGTTTFDVLSGVTWSQPMGLDGHFDFVSQVEDNSVSYAHPFNLRSASAYYHSPGLDVHAIDFSVDLVGGGAHNDMGAFSFNDFTQLRGAGVTLKRGDNQYTVFAGVSVPYYYLTLGDTRDVAGFSFYRQQNQHLALFAASSFINAPINVVGINPGRLNNVMQTAGFNYRFNKQWRMQVAGGESNHGGMARGEVDYAGRKLTMYTIGSISAPLFPLSQVQSLLTGTTFIRSLASLKNNDRFAETLSYQHTVIKPFGLLLHPGSSDVLSPGFVVNLTQRESLSLNYSYSRNSGGFTNTSSTGNQYGAGLNSQITPKITNNAQFTIGSIQDPLQLNSEDEYSFHDGITLPVPHGTMAAGFSYDHRNPSLVQKLSSELGLLAPGLQNLFLQDPVGFVNSNNLPPEVRAILEAEQPISASIFASAQLRLGKKLSFNPNIALARSTNGTAESWSPFVGYSLVYQVRPTFQLTSSLGNSYFLANSQGQVQRTTVFSVGFVKNFSAAPTGFFPVHHSRIIEGRVFRDVNVNGVFNVGEQGFNQIMLRLENGETALTDEQGRFKFSGVGAGVHEVSLDLKQFHNPVRMTTHSSMEVDLIKDRLAVADFGVVDFARLLGSVFNDLRFEGKRSADTHALPGVHLVLDDRRQKRNLVTDATGNLELDDLPPGDYTVTVERDTLPPNYILPNDKFQIHIAPVSTVTLDIPARALRSISGRVFLKVLVDANAPAGDPSKLKIGGFPQSAVRTQRGGQAGGKAGQAAGQVSHGQQGPGGQGNGADYNLVPITGVRLTAGSSTAVSDENGNFLLRDLPAGDLLVAVVPVKPVPSGIKVPTGAVRMPPEPIEVRGASIVISNPELVPYLAGKTADEVWDAALHPSQPDKISAPPPAKQSSEEAGISQTGIERRSSESAPITTAANERTVSSGNIEPPIKESSVSTATSRTNRAIQPAEANRAISGAAERAIAPTSPEKATTQSSKGGTASQIASTTRPSDLTSTSSRAGESRKLEKTSTQPQDATSSSPALAAVTPPGRYSPVSFTNDDFVNTEGKQGILLRSLANPEKK